MYSISDAKKFLNQTNALLVQSNNLVIDKFVELVLEKFKTGANESLSAKCILRFLKFFLISKRKLTKYSLLLIFVIKIFINYAMCFFLYKSLYFFYIFLL